MESIISSCAHLFRCPHSGEPLRLLEPGELDVSNRRIRSGEWVHDDGSRVASPLAAALRALQSEVVYRIDENIVCLLPHLAVRPKSDVTPASTLRREKQAVQSFYDDVGWVKSTDGVYNDTAWFTDVRTVARDYQRHCNARIRAQLDRGEFLLDVASGAIPHPEYLEFSRGYRVRVCVDFSIRALREAKAKLGDRGLYVLGDITRLPFRDDVMDAVISLHTIYHVPPEEQTTAVAELHRVVKPHGRVVIVYVWARSPLMTGLGRVRWYGGKLKSLLRRGKPLEPAPMSPSASEQPNLFFRPLHQAWYASQIRVRYAVRLRVWSAVSTEFQKRFFADTPNGRRLARFVCWLEDAFPLVMGRCGQYPMFVLTKPSQLRNGHAEEPKMS